MDDKEKVYEALREAKEHYQEKGGVCVFCDVITYKCIIVAQYNEDRDTMGPFYVFPMCQECIRVHATDVSSNDLYRKCDEALDIKNTMKTLLKDDE